MRLLAFSDLHLSDNPPAIRKKEPDWYQTQKNLLNEITRQVNAHSPFALIIAGDLFHTSIVSPFLEAMTIKWISTIQALHSSMIIIFTPGQHDLPGNNFKHLEKSSIEVLRCGCDLFVPESGSLFITGPKNEHAFVSVPYGEELPETIEKMRKDRTNLVSVSVITHRLLWSEKKPYPGASVKGNVRRAAKEFVGADIVISGDNHQPFDVEENGITFINCGRCQTRTATEMNYPPPSIIKIVIDDENGGIQHQRIELDINEVLSPEESTYKTETPKDDKDLLAFVQAVGDLGESADDSLSFDRMLEKEFETRKTSKDVQEVLQGARL